LKTKDEVLNKFQEFKALVENLSKRKIKVLRSNNGGEYTSNEFKDFCKEAGIKRELTTTYNSQQNGVAERKNKSIVEAAKAMIHDQSLPMHLWAKASSTTVYVQNRSPHKILGNKTPEELFTGKKPRGQLLEDIWLSNVHSCSQGKEHEVGAFGKEGHLPWIK
jgi:transposase InsO family protein